MGKWLATAMRRGTMSAQGEALRLVTAAWKGVTQGATLLAMVVRRKRCQLGVTHEAMMCGRLILRRAAAVFGKARQLVVHEKTLR